MKVVTITTRTHRNARRGVKALPARSPLHCIRWGDRYFAWAYTNKAFAEAMAQKLKVPTTQIDIDANWRRDPHSVVHSDRTSFDNLGAKFNRKEPNMPQGPAD